MATPIPFLTAHQDDILGQVTRLHEQRTSEAVDLGALRQSFGLWPKYYSLVFSRTPEQIKRVDSFRFGVLGDKAPAADILSDPMRGYFKADADGTITLLAVSHRGQWLGSGLPSEFVDLFSIFGEYILEE